MEDPKFFLKLQWHDKNYRQAVEDLKARLPLPWKPPISLNQVIEAYHSHIQDPFWGKRIKELEDPIMLSTWAGAQDRAEACLKWSWDYLKKNRDPLRGGSLLEWRRRMEAIMNDPDSLRQTARDEIIKHKLIKNPSCCFSDTPYQECLTKIPFD